MKTKISSLFFLIVMLFTGKAIAQWQSTLFPINGEIYSLAADDAKVYAGVNALGGGPGVYIYSNSWTSTSLIPSNYITSIAVDGQRVFAAGLIDAGVFFSNDSGQSWTQTYNGIPISISGLPNTNAVVINADFVFAGTGIGVYKTNDNGLNWTASGLNNADVRCMAVHGNIIYAGTYGNGLYSSADNGLTWSPMNNGITDSIILALFVNGADIYAGTNTTVFKALNNGFSWIGISSGLPTAPVNTITAKGSAVFTGTNTGVYLLNNSATAWTNVNSGLINTTIHSMTSRQRNIYAGTDGAGVYERGVLEMTNCFANNSCTYDSALNTFYVNVDSVSVATAVSYIWDFGDGTTSTTPTPIHIYPQNAYYNLCMKVITANGDTCTYCRTIGVDTLGIVQVGRGATGFILNVGMATNVSDNEINLVSNISPNPFLKSATILFSTPILNGNVELTDVSGNIKRKYTLNNSNTLEITKDNLASGMYFLIINDDNGNANTRKIIIQ